MKNYYKEYLENTSKAYELLRDIRRIKVVLSLFPNVDKAKRAHNALVKEYMEHKRFWMEKIEEIK